MCVCMCIYIWLVLDTSLAIWTLFLSSNKKEIKVLPMSIPRKNRAFGSEIPATLLTISVRFMVNIQSIKRLIVKDKRCDVVKTSNAIYSLINAQSETRSHKLILSVIM